MSSKTVRALVTLTVDHARQAEAIAAAANAPAVEWDRRAKALLAEWEAGS